MNRLSSSTSSDLRHRSTSQIKKQEQQLLTRNQIYSDTAVNSFLVSSSTSAIHISRRGETKQFESIWYNFIYLDAPEILLPSSQKRYVSSFKTPTPSTNSKQTQRLNYINDSVVIFKLSKERKKKRVWFRQNIIIIEYTDANNDGTANSQLSSKNSSLSTANTVMSVKIQPPPSPPRLSPMLKIEGQSKFYIEKMELQFNFDFF